jgi:hypothetical protein
MSGVLRVHLKRRQVFRIEMTLFFMSVFYRAERNQDG